MINWSTRWLYALAAALVLLTLVGIGLRRGDSREGGVVDPLATASPQDQAKPPQGGPSTPSAPTPTATPQSSARIHLPSTAVTQWETLTFSLEGFRPGEAVTLQAKVGDSFKEFGEAVTVDGEGKASDAEVLLPSWLESGEREIRAVGDSGQTVASGTIYVRAKELWANLSSYSLQQASKLGFIAGGFQPGDRVKAYLTQGEDSTSLASQQPLATMEADQAGNTVWTEVEVPVVRPGKYLLLMVGESGGEELKTSVEVAPLAPDLELSPWSGLPGREIDLNARGFLPEEEVEVFLGTAREPAATFAADQYGGIWGAGPIAIPMQSQGGDLPVTLRGVRSGAVVVREFAVIPPDPWMDLSSYSGYPGAAVTAGGGGFAAGERITLHVGSAQSPAVAETVADAEGRYLGLGPAQVPMDAERAVTFVVVGESTGTEASATFKVLEPFHPEIPAQPESH